MANIGKSEEQLNAKDLRIGNYFYAQSKELFEIVKIFTFDRKQKEHKINSKKNYVGLYAVDSNKYVQKDFDSFFPIILTEEWLIRFGFEKTKHYKKPRRGLRHFGYKKDELFLNLYRDDSNEEYRYYFIVNNYWAEIKHVHQLQNLYHALTGEELKFK